MVDLIRERLESYLEFDSDKLFIDKVGYKNNLIRIFGGAIRDIISGDPINDVDVLVGSASLRHVEYTLTSNGYKYYRSYHGKDLSTIYDMSIISEPHTFINKSGKIVQLIRPSIVINKSKSHSIESYNIYVELYHRLLSNVDISCCGVSYDGKDLFENYEGAIQHCLYKLFDINRGALMYNEKRIDHRSAKLQERGWEIIDKVNMRDKKIGIIIDKVPSINFKQEYNEGKLT